MLRGLFFALLARGGSARENEAMDENPYRSPGAGIGRAVPQPHKSSPSFVQTVRWGAFGGTASALLFWLIVVIKLYGRYSSVTSIIWKALFIWSFYILLLGTIVGILVGAVRKLLWLALSHRQKSPTGLTQQ